MIMGRQQTQRLIDLGGYHQAEQAGREGSAGTGRADHPQIGEPDIECDTGDAEGREQLQHRGRQEGDTQHPERPPAQGVAPLRQQVRLVIHPPQQANGQKAAQPVGEEAGQAGHRIGLRIACRLGTPTDQRHE